MQWTRGSANDIRHHGEAYTKREETPEAFPQNRASSGHPAGMDTLAMAGLLAHGSLPENTFPVCFTSHHALHNRFPDFTLMRQTSGFSFSGSPLTVAGAATNEDQVPIVFPFHPAGKPGKEPSHLCYPAQGTRSQWGGLGDAE